MATEPEDEVPWPTGAENYEITSVIGQGAFAEVVRARCKQEGPFLNREVAVKIITLENLHISMDDVYGEVRIMKLCRHNNLLRLHSSFVVKDKLWLVMPLLEKGSCYHILRVLKHVGAIRDGEGFQKEVIAAILQQTLHGLNYLHKENKVHRDLKAGNILLDSTGQVKIADFGVAGWLDDFITRREGKRDTLVGTPCWMAPEVMGQDTGYNELADIWSLGITALELAKGSAPYASLTPIQVLMRTMREPPPSLKTYPDAVGFRVDLGKDFNQFVSDCLQKDPSNRPSAQALLNHKFIKSAKQDVLGAFLADVPDLKDCTAVSEDLPVGYNRVVIERPAEPDTSPDSIPLAHGTTWYFPETAMSAEEADEEMAKARAAIDALNADTGDGGHSPTAPTAPTAPAPASAGAGSTGPASAAPAAAPAATPTVGTVGSTPASGAPATSSAPAPAPPPATASPPVDGDVKDMLMNVIDMPDPDHGDE